MKNQHLLMALTLLLSSFYPGSTAAETKTDTEMELGLLLNTGNTESVNLRGKIDVKYDTPLWLHHYVFDSSLRQARFQNAPQNAPPNENQNADLQNQNTSDTQANAQQGNQRQTTEQRWLMSFQSNYKLTEKNESFFLYAGYEDDRFNGFDYQAMVAAGYGHRYYESSNSHLDVESGPGYFLYQKASGEVENTPIVYVAVTHEWRFSPNATLINKLGADIPLQRDRNLQSRWVTSLNTKMTDALSVKCSLTLNYNSQVAAINKNLNTETSVTLVYRF